MGEGLVFAGTSNVMRFPIVFGAFPGVVAVDCEQVGDGGLDLLQCAGECLGAASYCGIKSAVVGDALQVAVDGFVSAQGLSDGEGR